MGVSIQTQLPVCGTHSVSFAYDGGRVGCDIFLEQTKALQGKLGERKGVEMFYHKICLCQLCQEIL